MSPGFFFVFALLYFGLLVIDFVLEGFDLFFCSSHFFSWASGEMEFDEGLEDGLSFFRIGMKEVHGVLVGFGLFFDGDLIFQKTHDFVLFELPALGEFLLLDQFFELLRAKVGGWKGSGKIEREVAG